jgi:hypothetical protein
VEADDTALAYLVLALAIVFVLLVAGELVRLTLTQHIERILAKLIKTKNTEDSLNVIEVE